MMATRLARPRLLVRLHPPPGPPPPPRGRPMPNHRTLAVVADADADADAARARGIRPPPSSSPSVARSTPRRDGAAATAASSVVRRDFHRTAADGADGSKSSSPFATAGGGGAGGGGKPRRKFTPTRAAVQLTPESRRFFKSIIADHARKNPDTVGVALRYRQASSGQPRMVFSFDFVSVDEVGEYDEGVSLEVLEDGVTPKPPSESEGDGLPKLYVDQNAFLKVLGATVDIGHEDGVPYLLDREGNRLDPNV